MVSNDWNQFLLFKIWVCLGFEIRHYFGGFGLATALRECHKNHGHAAHSPGLGHASAQLVVCQPSAWQTVAARAGTQPCSFVVNVVVGVAQKNHASIQFLLFNGIDGTLQLVNENWSKFAYHRTGTQCATVGFAIGSRLGVEGKQFMILQIVLKPQTDYIIYVRIYHWPWIMAKYQHHTICWQHGNGGLWKTNLVHNLDSRYFFWGVTEYPTISTVLKRYLHLLPLFESAIFHHIFMRRPNYESSLWNGHTKCTDTGRFGIKTWTNNYWFRRVPDYVPATTFQQILFGVEVSARQSVHMSDNRWKKRYWCL